MIRLPIPWSDRAIVIRDEDDPEPWFGAEELRTIALFALPKRRREWMLSRIAAKQLAMELGLCADPRACIVDRRRIGNWYVSLSHSGPYAAAAIEREPIGIDVQVVRELRESAAHLFLSDAEIAAMKQCVLPHRLLHFWCAKEAAWKERGGEISTLKQVPLRLIEQRATGVRFDNADTAAIADVIVAVAPAR